MTEGNAKRKLRRFGVRNHGERIVKDLDIKKAKKEASKQQKDFNCFGAFMVKK